MNFVGNQKIIARLEKVLAVGGPAQAYLFSGPQGVGKFWLAKQFAASLIEGRKGLDIKPDISNEAKTDIILLEPEIEEKKGITREKDISAEAVRESLAKLATFPYGGKYKVLIVRQAQKMNSTAQNALLKTLEEPNQTSILILVCDEESHLLSTIKSRCQSLSFGVVSDEELVGMLDAGMTNKEELLLLSLGRPGLLSEMLSRPEVLTARQELLQKVRKIFTSTVSEKISLAEELAKDNLVAIAALELAIWLLRKEALEANNASSQSLENFAGLEKIQGCIEIIGRTNANTRLALEELFLNL